MTVAGNIFERVNYGHSLLFSSLLNYISEEFGEEYIGNALTYVAKNVWIKEYVKYIDSIDNVLEYWDESYKLGGFEYEIYRPNKDYAEIIIKNCKTGAKQIIEKAKIGYTCKGYEWSFNEQDISYYCGHCIVNKSFIPNEYSKNIEFDFKCEVKKNMQNYNQQGKVCKLIMRRRK